MSAIDPMRPTHSAHTGMCMYLHPRGFRGDRPGWFLCTLTGKEVPKHRINNCVRGGCPDYRERDEVVAGDKGKRIKWDEPASETVSESSDVLTLREWAQDEMRQGLSMNQLVKQIGCSWSTLNNAVKQPVKQSAAEPEELGTCWDCGRTFPADSMHPDGDTLECEDCYRRAHQPAPEPPPPAPPAARCQRCEAPVDGRLIMSGVGTVCEPCADAIRQEWEAQQYPKQAPDSAPGPGALTPLSDPAETRRAAQAYLRHIGMGDQEVFALGIWLDAWRARGEAA